MARGDNAASSPPRRAGPSKAFSPESLLEDGQRSCRLRVTLLGEDANCHNNTSSRPDDFSGTTPGFTSSRRPTFPSSSASAYSAATAAVGGRNGSGPRPRTATAAGRTTSADVRDGFGVGLSSGIGTSTAGKRRPRSASSRFHTSPGRDLQRDTAERARRIAQAVSEGSGRGVEATMGRKADGVAGLPEGWAKAVDEESGHVYYYSDKR